MKNAYEIVEAFEKRVAAFAGAPHAVAIDCCTNALFLACKRRSVKKVWIPSRTYVSVPFAITRAGGEPIMDRSKLWQGIYYLLPYDIIDGAKRFKRGMYDGGLHCLSFHYKKHIPIGRGGMVLCSSPEDRNWLRKVRYDGREGLPYHLERIEMMGYHFTMTPEQAARGLALMDVMPVDGWPDLTEEYPDLLDQPVFNTN